MVPRRPPGVRLIRTRLDHLVYATPTLEATLAWVAEATGVRPEMGGTHPAWRTRNAILPLDGSSYLEVIGPDPGVTGPPPSIFRIDTLARAQLVTWAAKGTGLPVLARAARMGGIDLGRPSAGSRERPDGTRLVWELTDPFAPRAEGLVPFFIDWGRSAHPAGTAPARVRLEEFHAEYPDPPALRAMLAVVGVDLPVMAGPMARLVATLATPRGPVRLD